MLSAILVALLLFWLIDTLDQSYVIFDDEKIIEKNRHGEERAVYYNQIVYAKYRNGIDLLDGRFDIAGHVDIVYKLDSKDHGPKRIALYLSKKVYKKVFEA